MVEMKTKCIVCKKQHTCLVNKKDLQAYENGEGLTQKLFHYLTPQQRELFFISQICGICWDKIFSEDEK